MSKGIAAFVVVLAVILSIGTLSAVGYYDSLKVDYDDPSANQDVQDAADALTSPDATDTGGTALVEFTTGPANALQASWAVLSNTSGLLQLLIGLPKSVADPIQTFFQVIFGITFIGFLRGVANLA